LELLIGWINEMALVNFFSSEAVFRPRKKTAEQIDREIDLAVEKEVDALNLKYSSAANVYGKSMRDVPLAVLDTARELLTGLFDDSVGNIDEDFYFLAQPEIAKAVLDKNAAKLLEIMDGLFKASVFREAQRNVWENRAPDDGF